MIKLDKYEVLTFDCYGTLIDWESGMLAALRPVLLVHNAKLNDEQILELFAEIETEQEEGEYTKYREILRRVVQKFGERLGFETNPTELDSLANSIKNWQPFSDTVEALKNLKNKFKLAVISNIDDDLFAGSARNLDIDFDWIITAEKAKSYKPSLHNFELAIEKIGLPSEKILHIAQSIYHDIIPAKSLGLSTVWVNRRGSKEGFGATPSAGGQPDLEVPDLRTLVCMSNLNS